MSASLTRVTPTAASPGFVLVLAGGGYTHRAAHENAPVAHWLAENGIASGYLDYSVAPARYPTALGEVLTAIAELRAGLHGPVTGPLVILGFSAGGHLAGLAHTATKQELTAIAAARPELDYTRPDAAVLCYPVVSLTTATHSGSRDSLLGDRVGEPNLAQALSIDSRVDAHTGPTFLWHTADDTVVPASHSLGLATALGTHAIPYELHIYPEGNHGLGLAPGRRSVQEWTATCLRWLGEQGLGPDTTATPAMS